MLDLVFTVYLESAPDTPLVSPATLPTIRIRRLDTDALVVTDQDMDEVGDGMFKYRFTTTPADFGIEFAARVDADPGAAGQVGVGSRYLATGADRVLGDIHNANFKDRRWDKIGDKVFIYTDSGRGTVLYEFDVNSDLSDIAPV